MKIVYDREEDILMIEVLPNAPIDHAEQVGSVITHFNAQGQLVLLEVLDASAFVEALVQAGLKGHADFVPLAHS